MSAETLRRAAALMRARAEAAVLATGEGPWQFTGLGWSDPHMTYTVSRQLQTRVCEAGAEEQALHIASWHPAVALAVADLLDETAAVYDSGNVAARPRAKAALAIAAAYLDEARP